MCAFWLEIVSVCVVWGENFLRPPPSADIYDTFTVPAFFDAPIGSMTDGGGRLRAPKSSTKNYFWCARAFFLRPALFVRLL